MATMVLNSFNYIVNERECKIVAILLKHFPLLHNRAGKLSTSLPIFIYQIVITLFVIAPAIIHIIFRVDSIPLSLVTK